VKKERAFTLLELIMILLVVAILIALAVPQFQIFREKAIAAQAITRMGMLRKTLLIRDQFPYEFEYSDLGLSILHVDKYWFYLGKVPGPPAMFQLNARRINGAYQGTYINLDINLKTGESTWHGDHPGVPK